MDGGQDLDIFDINEGTSVGQLCQLLFLLLLDYWSGFLCSPPFTAAGLNLVEGDIVLDEVRRSIQLLELAFQSKF